MRAVPSADTAPELAVRAMLRGFASGYRLHRPEIPGKPDIAYVGRKKAIFVHGCFWHGHDCPRGARPPKANAGYWTRKIAGNAARDARRLSELECLGWSALIVWECELKDRLGLEPKLRGFLEL